MKCDKCESVKVWVDAEQDIFFCDECGYSEPMDDNYKSTEEAKTPLRPFDGDEESAHDFVMNLLDKRQLEELEQFLESKQGVTE
jgi:hypothetical protein